VNGIAERSLTGLAAAAAFPFVWFFEMRLLGHTQGMAFAGFLVLFWYAAPVYLTAGTAAAIVVEWAVGRLLAAARTPNALRAYILHAAAYAGAGYGTYVLLTYALFGAAPPGADVSGQAAGIGIPAALLYYHVSLAIRAVLERKHAKAFGAPIETERLILLPCTPERYRQAEAEGYPFGKHVKSYMETLRRHPRLLGWGVWLVRLKETGEVIGDAGFKGNPDLSGAVDLGYGYLPGHWGRGYATEAAAALVDWAFAHGAGRVTAETLRDNAASIRVLRKTGFRLYREDEHYHWRLDASERPVRPADKRRV